MRIGLDFDNTIVSYDALFHKVACEQHLVPAETPAKKVAVRECLRRSGREDLWTELQGFVYGARMDEARAYPGVLDFMCRARASGHTLGIISHKTRFPFLGPRYDLHAAASEWVQRHLVWEGESLILGPHVFFELTIESKLDRIRSFGCDVFVDDLPEILHTQGFPSSVGRILFDPEDNHAKSGTGPVRVFGAWAEIARHLCE